MATNIVAAPCKITLSMSITLGGVKRNVKWEREIADVKYTSNEIIPVGTTEVTIITFAASLAAGATFDEDDIRFLALYNRDDTNFIQIIIASENSNESAHKLEAKHFMIIPMSDEGAIDVHDADSSALTVSFDDITSITALADTAECDLETFGVIV